MTMRPIDLEADLNCEDDEGRWWSVLDWAFDPSKIVPGAIVVAVGGVFELWVIERFGAARLLTFDRDVATREPTVEVAHEALLREWPRLVAWLDQDRDVLRTAHAIAGAATTWDRGGRQESDLGELGREGGVDGRVAGVQQRGNGRRPGSGGGHVRSSRPRVWRRR